MINILITRYDLQASAATATQLEALGCNCYQYPLIQLEPIAYELQASDLRRANSLIITSSNVFKFLNVAAIEQLKAYQLYVVGQKTATIAMQKGFSQPNFIALTQQQLAEYIVKVCKKNYSFLYLTGKVRQNNLELQLVKNKIGVTIIECYNSTASQSKLNKQLGFDGIFDIILLYSATAAKATNQIEKYINNNSKFLCLSNRIARSLPSKWQAQAIFSDIPTECALLKCIKDNFLYDKTSNQ